MRPVYVCVFIIITVSSCNPGSNDHYIPGSSNVTDSTTIHPTTEALENANTPSWNYLDSAQAQYINPGKTQASELVDYAETLIGVPYLYGSSDPRLGFDCSGFITYVFNHFKIAVPRSSEGFTSVEREIPLKQAKRGDIILFTGTDSTKRIVGHMGIITTANQGHQFIHSTSGKAYGVTITPLNSYYQGRFVKVIRIFKHL